MGFQEERNEGTDPMFKRTTFGLTLAPAFALGVALTAYAANGWHGSPPAARAGAPTRCDTAAAVSVEPRDAVRLYELASVHRAQIAPRPAAPAPCAKKTERN